MGYVITLAGCPVLWTSKLQTEIALSMIEAEYIVLSTTCKDIFPLIDLVMKLGTALGLSILSSGNLHIRILEDSIGALTLGKLEPQCMTLCSKHNTITNH